EKRHAGSQSVRRRVACQRFYGIADGLLANGAPAAVGGHRHGQDRNRPLPFLAVARGLGTTALSLDDRTACRSSFLALRNVPYRRGVSPCASSCSLLVSSFSAPYA